MVRKDMGRILILWKMVLEIEGINFGKENWGLSMRVGDVFIEIIF